MAATRVFCLVFGIVYGLLGVVGFAAGTGDAYTLTVLPGTLVLGTVDHLIHVLVGLVFLVLGWATRIVPEHTPATT